MNEEDKPDEPEKPEDELAADDPLATALSLTGEHFVDDSEEDDPKLSSEEMDSLLAGVSERFADSSGETNQDSEDALTLAVLDGSASPEQLEKHETLLQDDGYRNRFEGLEATHRLVAETLPAALQSEQETEARPLPDETMDTLLAGVREQFKKEDDEREDRPEKKVISFPTYLLQLAAAAVVVFALVQFYDGDNGSPDGGGEAQIASVIEFGDWEDEHILRGGEEDDDKTADFQKWVEVQNYAKKSERQEWLDQETPGKNVFKVWVDRDNGVVKIHRPGKSEAQEIPLDPDKKERPQVLAILEKLREEIAAAP